MTSNNYIEIFTNIYENNWWGTDSSKDGAYKGTSGPGSSIDYNKSYISFIKNFIRNNNYKNIVDLGCGDWQSSRLIYNNLDVNYIGYDAYEKVIKSNKRNFPGYQFVHLDFINDKDKLRGGGTYVSLRMFFSIYV